MHLLKNCYYIFLKSILVSILICALSESIAQTSDSLLGTISSDSVNQNDNTPALSPSELRQEINNLKKALDKNSDSSDELLLLLERANKIEYFPAAVVANCKLAIVFFDRGLIEESKEYFKEARLAASRARGLPEVGWAMEELGNLMNNTGKLIRNKKNQYIPLLDNLSVVMNDLNKSMRLRGDIVFDKVIPGVDNQQQNIDRGRVTERRMPGTNDRFVYPQPPFASFRYNPAFSKLKEIKAGQIDLWVDTMLRSFNISEPNIQQLTSKKNIRDSSKALSNAFANQGNYEEAYKYYLQYTAYKDSLTLEATASKLASLELQKSLITKEAEISQLNKDKALRDQAAKRQLLFLIALVGCISLLFIILIILGRNNRSKKLTNQKLHEQKEALEKTLDELKLAQNQLIHAEKMASLGELTAGIAHEIQNPLNFVNNFSEVSEEMVEELVEEASKGNMEEVQSIAADLSNNLQKINQHGNRASSIVKGMLEHARKSTGEKEKVNINKLLDEYLNLSLNGFKAKDNSFNVTINKIFEPTLPEILVMPQDFGRVILNILNNAFYAVQDKQQHLPTFQAIVDVTTQYQPGQIIITIRDNGAGIPDELVHKIFQPFFTTKPTGKGTGLGLSLSYDIVTKGHNGLLELETEKDVYTAFRIILPISET